VMDTRLLLLSLVLLANGSVAPTSISGALSDVTIEVENLLRRCLNLSVDPCDDFYSYVCGNGITTNEQNPFLNRHEEIKLKQKEALEDILDISTSTSEQKLKNFYWKCLDSAALERDDSIVILQPLKELGEFPMRNERNISSNQPFDFTELMSKVHYRIGNPFFNLGVGPDYTNEEMALKISPPSVEFETYDIREIFVNPTNANILEIYENYLVDKVAFISELFGSPTTRAEIEAVGKELLAFTTELASILIPGSPKVEYLGKRLVSEIQEIFPRIDWKRYLKSITPLEVHSYFDNNTVINCMHIDPIAEI
ncbi:hypothetical protein PFISCL1PPCAC_26789, partial [Pristionchus fissidentatus]